MIIIRRTTTHHHQNFSTIVRQYVVVVGVIIFYISYILYEVEALVMEASVMSSKMGREIICMDAVRWLESFADCSLPKSYGIFTSLPDVSELPAIYGSGPTLQLREYKNWLMILLKVIMITIIELNGNIKGSETPFR
jgi:hypothetical protein